MIPLRDNIPSKTFPVVNYTLIVANLLFFFYELSMPQQVLERFLVEGLVRTADLPGTGRGPERWKTDEATGRLVAGRGGQTIGIGDLVTVRIMNVDLASRHLDLLLTELPERTERTEVRRAKAAVGARQKGHRKGYKKGRRGRRG